MKMEGINESAIDDAIKPISIKKTELILEQMKKCVCKIHNGRKKGTGFFTKVPFKNQSISVLITNNHVLGANEILPDKVITISLNNEEIFKNIKIDTKRTIYTSEVYDITIIELMEKDYINNYLNLDRQIIDKITDKDETSINTNKYFNNLFEKKTIYILNYVEEMLVSYGLLNSIDGNQISHKCYTQEGASGSPILLLESNKIIGVHNRGSGHKFKFNFGVFLVKPLIDFLTKYKATFSSHSNKFEGQIYKNNTNQNIDRIYNDIKIYYNVERDIVYKINNQSQTFSYQGFLVDKNWVDNWKKHSYYDYIKFNYLDKNINNEQIIKNYILDNQNNNNFNYNEIINVENFILKNINQLELPENQNKSFVLLNNVFLRQFPIRFNIIPISFLLTYQTVSISSQNNKVFSFQTNNNIIINKENNFNYIQRQINLNKSQLDNIYNSEYLKHLIKFAYLKGELVSQSNTFKNNINKAYIINIGVINKLKQLYELKKILKYLETNGVLVGITYHNFDGNYSKILNYLNNNKKDYINAIKNFETPGVINFTQNEISLVPKIYQGNKNLGYLDEIEIINTDFASFLYNKYKNIIMPSVNFVKIENKIFLNINYLQQNFYEIMKYNSDNNLTLDYLIEIIKNNKFKDINTLCYYIFNNFLKSEINNLYLKEDQISFDNYKFIFKIHYTPINPKIFCGDMKIMDTENNFQKSLDNSHYIETQYIENIKKVNINKKNKKKTKIVNFLFRTQNNFCINISIERYKRFKDLKKLYFEKINQLDLLNDESIFFMCDGESLLNEDLLDDFCYEDKTYQIVVADYEEKITAKYNF